MERYMIGPCTHIRFLISSMDVVEGDIYLAIGLMNIHSWLLNSNSKVWMRS